MHGTRTRSLPRRSCGFLLDASTPNARGPHGEAIWWCACGRGTFSSSTRLRAHIVGRRLLYPVGVVIVALLGCRVASLWAAALAAFATTWRLLASSQRLRGAPSQPSAAADEQPLPYDALRAPCLRSFSETKAHTPCPFARAAVLWGGRSGASPEQHVAASLEAFGIFARESAARALDGFVFEVAEGGGASLDEHARHVKHRVVKHLPQPRLLLVRLKPQSASQSVLHSPQHGA